MLLDFQSMKEKLKIDVVNAIYEEKDKQLKDVVSFDWYEKYKVSCTKVYELRDILRVLPYCTALSEIIMLRKGFNNIIKRV